MSAPVRIALVGMGWWGKKMLSVLEAAPQDIKVVHAVEPNLETVRSLCAEREIALSADYADALNDPAVEAVVLATPHALHEAQIEAAVAAGKHVFCEKPLALTKAGAEKAVNRCRDAGLVLGMGHERRFDPPIAALLAKSAAGELGRIQQIEANFSHDKFLALDRDNWRLKADQAPGRRDDGDRHPPARPLGRLLGRAESVSASARTCRPTCPRGTQSRPMSSSAAAAPHTFRPRLRTLSSRVSRFRVERLDRHPRQGPCRGP